MEDVIINNNKSGYAVRTDQISCDFYDYLDGKLSPDKVNLSRYMEQFSWGAWPVSVE